MLILPYSQSLVTIYSHLFVEIFNLMEFYLINSFSFAINYRSSKDFSVYEDVEFDGEDTWETLESFNYLPHSPKDKTKDNNGYVEDIEQISNEQYRKQLE